MISFKEAKELTQNSKYTKAMRFIESDIMDRILKKNFGANPSNTLMNPTNDITITMDPSEIDDEVLAALETIGKENGYNIYHFPSVECRGKTALYISWPVIIPAYNIKKPADDSGILNVGELAFVTIVRNSVEEILDRLDINIKMRAERGYTNSEIIYRPYSFADIDNTKVVSDIIDNIIDTVKRSIDQSFIFSYEKIKEDDNSTPSKYITTVKFYVSWK